MQGKGHQNADQRNLERRTDGQRQHHERELKGAAATATVETGSGTAEPARGKRSMRAELKLPRLASRGAQAAPPELRPGLMVFDRIPRYYGRSPVLCAPALLAPSVGFVLLARRLLPRATLPANAARFAGRRIPVLFVNDRKPRADRTKPTDGAERSGSRGGTGEPGGQLGSDVSAGIATSCRPSSVRPSYPCGSRPDGLPVFGVPTRKPVVRTLVRPGAAPVTPAHRGSSPRPASPFSGLCLVARRLEPRASSAPAAYGHCRIRPVCSVRRIEPSWPAASPGQADVVPTYCVKDH